MKLSPLGKKVNINGSFALQILKLVLRIRAKKKCKIMTYIVCQCNKVGVSTLRSSGFVFKRKRIKIDILKTRRQKA